MKMNKEVVMVRISDIIPNRFQPRLTFDEEALNELSNSIKEHGIIQPLILRDLGSKYEIIAGERRYKASQLAGLTEVPAIIGSMDDQTSAELALIENIQRKDLSAIEEAKSYKIILDMGSFTQEELAKRMGKSQSTIANKMRLLSLTNEVQVALMNNLISERHARCLLQVKNEDEQKDLLNKIISERMNVRDTDDYIKNILGISKQEVEIPKEGSTPSIQENIINIMPLNNGTEEKNEKVAFEVPQVNIPEVKEEKVLHENPNVYTQTNSMDFVDISSLDKEEPPVNTVKSALSGLDIINKDSNVFKDSLVSVEEKKEPGMNKIEEIIIPEATPEQQHIENPQNDISKLKLATAIKIAKDSVESIKLAGYDVVMEEVDADSNYQIIIKVQK